MRPLLTRTAAGILAIGLLAGCSASGDAPDPAPQAEDKSAAGEDPTASAGAASPDAVPARVVAVDTGNVIAEQVFKVPGSEDTVTVGVQSLIVEGKTMKLQLVITPNLSSISDSA